MTYIICKDKNIGNMYKNIVIGFYENIEKPKE